MLCISDSGAAPKRAGAGSLYRGMAIEPKTNCFYECYDFNCIQCDYGLFYVVDQCGTCAGFFCHVVEIGWNRPGYRDAVIFYFCATDTTLVDALICRKKTDW